MQMPTPCSFHSFFDFRLCSRDKARSVRPSVASRISSFFHPSCKVPKEKMRRSITQAATAAARRQSKATSTSIGSPIGPLHLAGSRQGVAVPISQYQHDSFASASDAASATTAYCRRRTFSTAAATSTACHDDCGKPCPEDCEGHSLNPAAANSSSFGPTNYFHVLNLPEQTYQIDPTTLKSTYKRLMAQYHPDRYHSLHDPSSTSDHPPRSMDELHELSSSITRAYDVLSDPHSRAEHLLELHDAAITENCSELVDMALLMEVMELREEIDEASDDVDILRTLLGQNEERMEKVVKLLGEAFDGRKDMEEARRLTAQLQYWKRIEEKIVDKLSTVK